MYSNSSTKPISLLEAYTICFNEVSIIDPNAELSILTSTDKENKIYKIIKGSDENKYELKLIRNHVENGLDLLISNDNDELLHYIVPHEEWKKF